MLCSMSALITMYWKTPGYLDLVDYWLEKKWNKRCSKQSFRRSDVLKQTASRDCEVHPQYFRGPIKEMIKSDE